MWTLVACALLATRPALLSSTRRAVLLSAASVPLAAHASAKEVTPPRRCCLVAGATGRTGRFVVDALRGQDSIDVIAGVRSEGSIKKLSAGVPTLTGLDVTSTDPGFTSWLSKEMSTRSVTDVICTLGFSPTFIPSDDRELAATVDYLGTLKLIRAAEAAKLSGRFVLVSSLGINATTESA